MCFDEPTSALDPELTGDDDDGDDPEQRPYQREQEALHGLVEPLGAVERFGDELHQDVDDNDADQEGYDGAEQRAERETGNIDLGKPG